MRLATYNIEWFANLFDKNDALIVDESWSGRHDVTKAQQVEAIAKVLTAIDADAVLIVEAPNTGKRQNTVRALQAFAEAFDLRTSDAVMGFANDTHQELALLYDRSVLDVRHDPKGDADDLSSPRFDGEFKIDLDVDATEDIVRFSKPPMELALTTRSGKDVRLIGAHLKSKAPHGADSRDEAIRISIANRRKQLAQAVWLARRVEAHLAQNESVVLLGDLNDGPGLDEFEHLFGRSSVEILLQAGLYDPHAIRAHEFRPGSVPSTARFARPDEGQFLEALLDYIMISEDLRAFDPAWRIWHPFRDVACWSEPELRQALLAASDHFPVTLDIDL
ncbi:MULTISPECIES: endonuclease/exonuclease/phosphatase family protein [unclassified Ruegeria]|uniref:endonuclease/exonuclease/phosphatase family protein n=1 Tax=unclassified Ruegeria TaxID=2625375 RepID=UPI001488DDCC|nr:MULTISPECIES: endonuclease/exonuclease/phosphatase family protein [unclassified Ruegeria]NOD74685.1 endonuclease [Ruegeria sp. HKCCD4332]NOD88581.1 endonuclease [Ruegeria sp. HKCCD4318]NOE12191.1 endonuclease [Ruegeria sp. HKCCD4318-2]NOG09644.1 endonuclease [Ruegeria sp. HKCCD4315]